MTARERVILDLIKKTLRLSARI